MSPSHVAALSALASAVAGLRKSKSKDAKAVLADLAKNHADAMSAIDALPDDVPDDSALSFAQWLTCCVLMNVSAKAIKAGTEPCIVEGRYAVRTKDGLKLGPAVS